MQPETMPQIAITMHQNESSDDELLRNLAEALNLATAACDLDGSHETQLACELYDKCILYIDEALGKIPSDTQQYLKLIQLRNDYDDRMELLKSVESSRYESTNSRIKENGRREASRSSQKALEEDERILEYYLGSKETLFETHPDSSVQIPYWRMRLIQGTIQRGAFLSESFFVPSCVWTQRGVKFCGLSLKISAFQAIASIVKEIEFVDNVHDRDTESSHILVLLLMNLRTAKEELFLIQNQLSKPFLFISEVSEEESFKSPTVKSQVPLSRFTNILTSFGKSVINYADIGYQRLGTMATKVSEEDFAIYTFLVSQLCQDCQVFELIRISVEKELQRLNHNLFFYTDPGPSQNRSRSAPPKPSRGPDYHSRIAATAQKSFDDCCSSVSSGEGEGGDSSGTEPDVDGDPVNESFSSSSHSISIPVSVSVRASMSNVHPSHDTGAPQSQSELVLQSAPHAMPMARDSALPRAPSEAAVPSLTPTTPSTCTPTTTPTSAFVAEELKRLRTLQDILAVLSSVSHFMRDVVCEIVQRDLELLTLKYLQKTRKSFSRMHWDEELTHPNDDGQGILDF